MDDRIGFSVESRSTPKKQLGLKLGALLLLLMGFAWLYFTIRPAQEMSGQYEGILGNQYSNAKEHLEIRLAQEGKKLRGDCRLSHQRGRDTIERVCRALVGNASGTSFKLQGLMSDGQKLYFEGEYMKITGGVQIKGTVTATVKGRSAEPIPFLGRFKNAITPKELMKNPL